MLRKILMAASLVVFANTAMAGTWAAASSGTAPSFAAELFGDGTVVVVPDTAGYTMASTPATGTAFNIDYTLTGGTWGAALSSASVTITGGSSGTTSITLVEGGALTQSTAKFRVDVTNTFGGNRLVTLTYQITGASALTTPAATVKLAISLTDSLGALDTAGAAQTVATSAEGTTANFTPHAVAGTLTQIDVSTGNTLYVTPAGVAATQSILGVFDVDDVAGPVEADGTTAWQINQSTATLAAGVAAATVTINGDFAAAVGFDADENALTNDGVAFSGCGTTPATYTATTLTATAATFSLSGANVAAIEAGGDCEVVINIPATNTTLLTASAYTASLAADYTNVDFRDESTVGAFRSIAKNGASAATDLILTPGGVFSGFVRVSNKSAIPGKVIVTLFNDAGASVTFDLAGGTLAAQASTALVSAADLYAQAQAADATFAHNDGKLRATFEGEFSAIAAQSVTISTDNTTFSTF